ncbi:DUF2812 domain-containing protein [Saccharibacillus alkalitolerans]|uniref:DUF2812 domain-containing protein n=1 Tax=Saccharibacillus alkalitolerans TaxID=2705290 RepID=A0ABX0F5X4_9BACL|nr:DUF2812 domain-containing protein [Saccharibacillus alkalitolerans]NGZ76357.1 DUF2812 domain-containing protein [Saccharibacillus alkalitolerans]
MIMKRTKWFFDHEKEEKWLNEMGKDGWQLKKVKARRYTFERGKPGSHEYGMLLLDAVPALSRNSRSYIDFMESSGAEYVSRCFRWAYFRRETDQGPFRVYTDRDSLHSHYRRVAMMNGLIGVANVTIALSNLERGIEIGWVLSNAIVSLPFLWAAYLYVGKMRKAKKDEALYE